MYGKYVTGVPRGQEMIDVSKIPRSIAPRTRYIMSNKVKILNDEEHLLEKYQKRGEMEVAYPPVKIPTHIVGFLKTPRAQ